MNAGVAVDVLGIRRSFGRSVVLNGLDFTAKSGEFVAVVGRSGTGKSTLLRLLVGLDRPNSGEVRIDGIPLNGLCPVARVVFQDGRLLPWLRVGENVALGLSRRESSRSLQMLESVDLVSRVDDWPAVLSGGQRQRVALARALAGNPKLLLLDEPLGSLDALTRLEMQLLIENLWLAGGFTVVLITHDVDEAVTLADRVVLIDSGRITNEWPIDLPRPRERTSSEFGAIVRSILTEVMNPATN